MIGACAACARGSTERGEDEPAPFLQDAHEPGEIDQSRSVGRGRGQRRRAEMGADLPAAISIAKGDVFRLVTAGGGGYGDPSKRRDEAIADDITNGYLSREAAAAQYGARAK